MKEEPYESEHLQSYTGILTSHDTHSGKFKMELKVEDNPVLRERWTEKNVSTIELEFRYNGGPSTMFFHNRHTCPVCLENKECREYERMRKIYDVFHANLSHLQFGDTFSIQAALINNDQSMLPAEIHSFENYQPLLAACTEYRLRLDDTPEGNNKRYEREQQRKQQEREAEEKRKEDEEQAQKDAKTRQRDERIQQIFGDKPYIPQIITSVIGGLISGIILTTIFDPIPRLFRWIISLF